MSLAQTISQIRRERKMSMRLLASSAGLSVTFISKIEAGDSENVTVATLNSLAAALSVPADMLFRAAASTTPSPPLPAYLYDVAPALTEADWVALRLPIEHVATLRRNAPPRDA